jgi:hypothetical protein
MATDYGRNREARGRTYNPSETVGYIISAAVVLAIIGMLAFALMDRTPTGPNSVTSTPPNSTTTTQPKTTAPSENQQSTPSTK